MLPTPSEFGMTTGEKPHSNSPNAYKESLIPLRDLFFETGSAARILASRSALVDDLVRGMHTEILADAATQGLALLAVGGYGRRELFPFSDIDLLILVDALPNR